MNVVEFKLPVDADIADMLAGFLDKAKSGEIAGIAIAAYRRDGAVITHLIDGPNPFLLLGAIRLVGRRAEDRALGLPAEKEAT